MANNKIKKKEGFTIIEVVLVLAIAGLIFLMVFVALPALQSSQRDTQRREDMGRLVTAITNYKANNRNKLPDDGSTLISNYLSNDFTDPDGTNYTVKVQGYNKNQATPAGTTFNHTAYLITGAKCKDGSEGTVEKAVGDNNYAIVFKFEGSGVYCSDDS
ncbi:MAG: type II secretion system protein [Candidatus Saccharibacteria bacterium]|nr:type II secretion system protein [Candidatus Saccharibacteria bacterium]